jgi:hypothetical protein
VGTTATKASTNGALRLALVAGALALAAVLFWVIAGRNGETGRSPLPDYVAASPSSLRLHAGDAPFEIVVRPATMPATKVVAYAFAIGEGEPNPVEAKVEIAPEGSIRIRGRARALERAREVRVVVGVAEQSIKRFDDALARARDGTSDASVRVVSVPIVRD